MQSQILEINVEELIFDEENPRLPKSVNGSNEKDVINWMLLQEKIIELMASIAQNGFFSAEPILVVKSLKYNNKYEVLEGNRRLTAVKILNNPNLADIRVGTIKEILSEANIENIPKKLPCVVFDKREDVLFYLGYRHVTGVEEWDALAKARYLQKIRESLNEADADKEYRIMAKIIGSRADYVKLILTGYEIYEKIEDTGYFGIKGLNDKNFQFGVLYTAISRSPIASFIELDDEKSRPAENVNMERLKELATWIYEKNSEGRTRLGESRNLQQLSKVLESNNALKAFREGKSLKDAMLFTNEPIEIFQKSIYDSLESLKNSRDYIHFLVGVPNKVHIQTLKEIIQLSTFLHDALSK